MTETKSTPQTVGSEDHHKNEPIHTLEEFARREKVPVQTVRLWRMKGKDPVSFKVGKHVRYRLSDIEAWEQEQIDKAA